MTARPPSKINPNPQSTPLLTPHFTQMMMDSSMEQQIPSSSSSPPPAPKLRYEVGSTVVPGDRLGNVRQVRPGTGTHVKGGHVYATRVGELQLTGGNNADSKNTPETNEKDASQPPLYYTCSVDSRQRQEKQHPSDRASSSSSSLPASMHVLKVGQLVVGRVLRLTPQNTIVEICLAEHVGRLSVKTGNHNQTPSPVEGCIRMEDIRRSTTPGASGNSSNGSSSQRMSDWFQPTDWVVCRVIALGDARRYFLSTAEKELGVIRAYSKTSHLPMMILSWKEMECPKTGIKEFRKCAKPTTPGTGTIGQSEATTQ